jgi:predicted transcriptional regulator
LDSNIEILIDGDKEKISETQKRTLKGALNNESEIKSESEKALKEQFDNAELEFVSIEKHFDVDSITVNDNGFELSFQEKNDPYYYFNVHFEDNKQVGVSIDG